MASATPIRTIPERAWAAAYDAGRHVRDGAWVAELTGMLHLVGWPKGIRVIVRRERLPPTPSTGFTDICGYRYTAFATRTKGGQLADLELRNCGTAAAPAAKTASGPPTTAGCATSSRTATPRTRSGPRSSAWPASCWPG